MKRAALVVGINRYEDPEISSLKYAENDAVEVYSFLKSRHEFSDVRNMLNPDSDEILDAAHAIAGDLSPGDLLLVYFAGHGTEHNGQHLLLCPKARYSRIKHHQHVISLDLLKEETAREGVNRMMVLDTCRNELLTGQRGAESADMRDVKCIREMVEGPRGDAGALGILCSCDQGERSREIENCRQGLFSISLVEAMREMAQTGEGVYFSEALSKAISAKMNTVGDRYGIRVTQRPWVQVSGDLPALIEPENRVKVPRAEPIIKEELSMVPQTERVPIMQKVHTVPSVKEVPREELVLTIPGSGRVELRMMLIPAGSFIMGSPKSEKGRFDNEGPQHKVTITIPFHMGIYPVTQAQWKEVLGRNPSLFKGPDNPVESISWVYCQKFISKLNAMGLGYFRLPTEAEWEYACRAGSATRFPWGDDKGNDLLGQYAWYDGNSSKTTHPVGKKEPNAWGLYDMHGNVYEWCSDWYGPYSSAEHADPEGPEGGSDRVGRGGSWSSHAQLCRPAFRFNISPLSAYSGIGFRLVRML